MSMSLTCYKYGSVECDRCWALYRVVRRESVCYLFMRHIKFKRHIICCFEQPESIDLLGAIELLPDVVEASLEYMQLSNRHIMPGSDLTDGSL